MTDDSFRERFESGAIAPSEFTHRAHLRLAWVYVDAYPVEEAHRRMRQAIRGFLAHHGVDPGHYHETMTRAWIDAVAHFRESRPSADFGGFIARCPELLDSSIMLTHYSKERLMSAEARADYLSPDLQDIPAN